MPDLTKIATCSYCGTRSVLQLRGKVQHELACGSCGAKLHTMKPLRVTPERPKQRATPEVRHRPPPRPARRKPKRRRLLDLVEDIWDEIEDIFD